MSTVAFMSPRVIDINCFGSVNFKSYNAYAGKIFEIKNDTLQLVNKTSDGPELVAQLPLDNVLAVSNTDNCFLQWSTRDADCWVSSSAVDKIVNFLVIDDFEECKPKHVDTLKNYIVIRVAADTINDNLYILLHKEKFDYKFTRNRNGIPVMTIHSKKYKDNIVIPSSRVIDVQRMEDVHGYPHLNEPAVQFSPTI